MTRKIIKSFNEEYLVSEIHEPDVFLYFRKNVNNNKFLFTVESEDKNKILIIKNFEKEIYESTNVYDIENIIINDIEYDDNVDGQLSLHTNTFTTKNYPINKKELHNIIKSSNRNNKFNINIFYNGINIKKLVLRKNSLGKEEWIMDEDFVYSGKLKLYKFLKKL